MTEADLAKTLEGLSAAALEAVKITEYKYFGDYELSADQWEAVDTLVGFARVVTGHLRTGQLIVAQAGDVPDDVRTLVIAAREAWESNGQSGDDLDRALEPFSSRVPYDDEPEHVP